jgi:hypothetical protein
MAIATLKLDEASKLGFGVEITGAGGVPEVRFIIEGKDFNISYPCKQTNEGVQVEISGLKGVLNAGEYQTRLEVILENKVYTPMRDTIVFEPSVEILSKQKVVAPLKESVKVSKITVHKPNIDESKKSAAMIIASSLGYQPSPNESPISTINNALMSVSVLESATYDTLVSMLELAEEVGIKFDRDAIPSKRIEVHTVQEASQDTPPKKQQSDDEDDISDEELDAMIDNIQDWDHIIDAYDADELAIIDDETGEVVDEDLTDDLKESELNEVLSRAERLKAKIRFARTSAKRQVKARIALKRHSSSATINKRARRLAINTMKTKLAKGRNLATLSVPEKERIEKLIQKRSNMVGRLAMKLTPKVKNIERSRLTHHTYTQN